jgi:hypothetical protein
MWVGVGTVLYWLVGCFGGKASKADRDFIAQTFHDWGLTSWEGGLLSW